MQRVHGKKEGGPLFKDANDYGAKCQAGKQGKQIGQVDVAWAFDGVGPITMGFSNPHSYIQEWQQAVFKVAKKKGSVNREDFVNVLIRFINSMDPCNDKTAAFSDDLEMRRHVFEALDVLRPDVSGKHEYWNATCSQGNCKVPRLCSILSDAVKEQAGALFDKLSKDGKLDPAVFAKQPRRLLQDALVGTFVRDQIAAVFEEVTGDYEGASGQSAVWENRDNDDADDGDDGKERDEM